MQIFLTITGLLLAGGLTVSWVLASQLSSTHVEVIEKPPADLPVEEITLHSETGNTIRGWYLSAPAPTGVVVLLHPLRQTRQYMLRRARLLWGAGYSIVMIDLQGHGESTGDRITMGHLEQADARAAVEFAQTKHPGERIGLVAVSLGGASALLASPPGLNALVVESVYSTIHMAVWNRVVVKVGRLLAPIPSALLLAQFPLRLGCAASRLRPIDKLPHIDCPVYVMSGTADRHTTEAETRAMYDAATEPKKLWLVEGAEHEDLYDLVPDEYEPRLLGFLQTCLRDQTSCESSAAVISTKSA